MVVRGRGTTDGVVVSLARGGMGHVSGLRIDVKQPEYQSVPASLATPP